MPIDFMCVISGFCIKSSLSSKPRNRVLFTKNVIHPFLPKFFDAERKQIVCKPYSVQIFVFQQFTYSVSLIINIPKPEIATNEKLKRPSMEAE